VCSHHSELNSVRWLVSQPFPGSRRAAHGTVRDASHTVTVSLRIGVTVDEPRRKHR